MDAERWRYLAQQMALGGKRVVLSQPVGDIVTAEPARPAASTPPVSSGDEVSSLPIPPAEPPMSVTPEPRWKKGAPPIPGPGLVIESPPAGLLGDDLSRLETLDAVAERIRSTTCCGICAMRTNAVPGEGNPHARLMLVGEGPGAQEDATGRPFVGAAGQLLDKMLEAIDLPRPEVFIANVMKCRPPQNRKPLPDEMAACLPYLRRQIQLIRPKVLVALGSTAGEALLSQRVSLGQMREKVHRFDGIPLVVTYHPAALLRNPNWKKPAWDDVRIARQLLDL